MDVVYEFATYVLEANRGLRLPDVQEFEHHKISTGSIWIREYWLTYTDRKEWFGPI